MKDVPARAKGLKAVTAYASKSNPDCKRELKKTPLNSSEMLGFRGSLRTRATFQLCCLFILMRLCLCCLCRLLVHDILLRSQACRAIDVSAGNTRRPPIAWRSTGETSPPPSRLISPLVAPMLSSNLAFSLDTGRGLFPFKHSVGSVSKMWYRIPFDQSEPSISIIPPTHSPAVRLRRDPRVNRPSISRRTRRLVSPTLSLTDAIQPTNSLKS